MSEDKFEKFKANVAAQTEYREEYAALTAGNPNAAVGLPHPDGKDYDPAEALAAIRRIKGGQTLKGVPGEALKT